ncbi:MAG: DUF115 domain-containing protein, partial [Treponema sp.]|uniref:6-hydroxymethylpterin diphosphokinase MptE-like protein n=1 Tax=Treponema sp. TaxID=166 RepID=UPI0025CD69AE
MIEFKPAKNNEITATYNGLWLHSSYNPSKEAERFAESLQPAKSDRFIIIIEPALSYCASFIKKRFPDKKTGAIRLVKDFSDYNGNFDFIIDLSNEKKESFSEIIFNTLGEEKIYSTYFADWEPSRKSFTEMHEECINAIKTCMEKSKTLLVTREYFEKKWFLNTLNFIKYTKNTVKLCKKIDRDILIIASGPSLHENLNTIKTYRRNFFIIVLSSAISVCSKNNIIPDLCMSTDGGFWAGEHLKRMPEKSVLALSSESFCSRRILEKCNILPMQYEDGLSRS